MASSSKKIWLAASDGDLERVKHLVETEGVSPSAADENTYTPLHAAASWSHEPILRFLVSKGGLIDVTDEDGETPLFVVESESMAQVCIELGADARHRSKEGHTASDPLTDAIDRLMSVQAAVHHAEDNPAVAAYLASITGEILAHPNASSDVEEDEEEEGMEIDQDVLDKAQAVMAEAERTGQDPDEALREIVAGAVGRQLEAGRSQAAAAAAAPPEAKRRRDDVGR